MSTYYDAFISYGRANSKEFAIKLNQKLEQENLKIWFDKNDIPPAVDWQEQINDGIKKADNFLFIISPHSVKSEYCFREIELAVKLNKRIIPLLHVNSDAQYDLMHPIIKEKNWLSWLENTADFDFEASFQELLATLRQDTDYIKQHTQYLISALEWERNQKQTQYLLIGEDRAKAESWLSISFADGKQAPCFPTDLHYEYICESSKKAHNLLTQIFKQKTKEHYLKKIEEILSTEGELSLPAQDTLDELRDELGLTSEEAHQLQISAFEPYKKYQENLQKYEKTLLKLIQQEYPLSDKNKNALKLRQRDLGIKPDDVEQIEKWILGRVKGQIIEGQNNQTPPVEAVSNSQTEISTTLDPIFLERCQQELARYIGPIAGFIVDETLSENYEIFPQQLVDQLAKEIPNDQNAKQFKKNLL